MLKPLPSDISLWKGGFSVYSSPTTYSTSTDFKFSETIKGFFEEKLRLHVKIQETEHKSAVEEWKDESLNAAKAEQGPYVMY